MTKAVETRAPALPESVKVDAITSAFEVDKNQLKNARERLYTDISKMDYIWSDQNGKTAAKRIAWTIFSIGIYLFYVQSKVNSQNAVRKAIRNPVDFTRAINMLNNEAVIPKHAANGIHTQDACLLENGSKTAQTREHNQTMTALETYQSTLSKLDKAIDTIVADVPAADQKNVHRALYAALSAQAAMTKYKTEFGGDSRDGLTSTRHADGISDQEFAIHAAKLQWYKGNALVAGREIASKVTGVGNMSRMTTEKKIKHLDDAVLEFRNRELDLITEAARVVELRGGKVPRENNGTPKFTSKLMREMGVIRERYADEVASKADAEIALAIGRINSARNVELLKDQFLADRKAELKALAGNTEKGETRLTEAIRFLNVSSFAQRTTAKQLGKSREDLELINANLAENTPDVQKSLTASKAFLEQLEENFANYVREREAEAQANNRYIEKLLAQKVGQPSTNGPNDQEQQNSRIVQAIKQGEEATINGLTVAKSIQPAQVNEAAAESITTADLKELLTIVVGNGETSNPGSATLTAALLDSLANKRSKEGKESRLADVFAAIGIENASGFSTITAAAANTVTTQLAQARKEHKVAEAFAESFWFNNADYKKAAQKSKQLAAKVGQLAASEKDAIQDRVKGSDAYVFDRSASGASRDEVKANKALIKKKLVKQFTNGAAIKALRVALGTIAAETASVDGSSQADGIEDAAAAAFVDNVKDAV